MCNRCEIQPNALLRCIPGQCALCKVCAVVGDDAVGTPYLHTMSATKRTTVGPSSFLIGRASIHLVNLSTSTRRCVMPLRALLNGPTMSKPHTANGHAIGIVFNADAG